MKYAVELVFDNQTQEKLNKIRKLLAENGVHDEAVTLNHVSIMDIETDNVEQLVETVRNFAQQHHVFDVVLSSAGSFMTGENVLFALPTVNEQLLNANKEFLQMAKDIEGILGAYYMPNNWVPHATLAIRLSDAELIIGFGVLKQNNILPLTATIEKIDILRYNPKPYKQIAIFDLQK